jgi:hypothetical protein
MVRLAFSPCCLEERRCRWLKRAERLRGFPRVRLNSYVVVQTRQHGPEGGGSRVAVTGGSLRRQGGPWRRAEALNFDTYVKALSDLAVGLGLVAVGRGITKAGAHVGKDDVSR